MQDDYIRAFIAIELPDAIQKELARLQDKMAAWHEPNIKLVAPESIHLTLKFLGNVATHRLPELEKGLETATSQSQPFKLELDTLGAFPNHSHPEIIWCGLKGNLAQLMQLQRMIEACLVRLNFPAETRPFSPHLTLARLRREIDAKKRENLTAKLGESLFTEDLSLTIEGLSLMQSRLTPKGAVHTRLAEFLFTSAVK